jgi:hypothetical protein
MRQGLVFSGIAGKPEAAAIARLHGPARGGHAFPAERRAMKKTPPAHGTLRWQAPLTFRKIVRATMRLALARNKMKETSQNNQPCTDDSGLLERYRGHLIERGVTQPARTSLITIARHFLEWWRQSFIGEQFTIEPQRRRRSSLQLEWVELRETYLRTTCPDHQVRCAHRIDLTAFLDYLAGSH